MATPRLPQLKQRGLLIFRLCGWPLAGLTLATLAAAPFVALDAAVAAWGSLGTAFGLGSGAVALAAALLLLLRRPRDPVAALLSVAFLGIGVGSGPSGLTLAALGLEPAAEVLRLAGFGALFIGVFVFPAGRFEPRWSLWGSLAAFGLGDGRLARHLPADDRAAGRVQLRRRRLDADGDRGALRALRADDAGDRAAADQMGGARLRRRRPARRDRRDPAQRPRDHRRRGGRCRGRRRQRPSWPARLRSDRARPARLAASLPIVRRRCGDQPLRRAAVLTVGLGALFTGSSEGIKIFIETSLGREAGAWPAGASRRGLRR